MVGIVLRGIVLYTDSLQLEKVHNGIHNRKKKDHGILPAQKRI